MISILQHWNITICDHIIITSTTKAGFKKIIGGAMFGMAYEIEEETESMLDVLEASLTILSKLWILPVYSDSMKSCLTRSILAHPTSNIWV